MRGIYIDIETSGLDPFVHYPLEIGCVIVDLLSGEELGSYESLLQISPQAWEQRDPESTRINGLSFQQLASGKTSQTVAHELTSLLLSCEISQKNAFFICQNPSFDRPFFCKILSPYQQDQRKWPYHWLDLASMYWALQLVHKQITQPFSLNLSKDTIAEHLSLPPEAKPHRAINGVRHLLACYEKLVGYPQKKMSDLPSSDL